MSDLLRFPGGAFNLRDTSGSSRTNYEMKAAPTAGQSICISDVVINAGGTARTWQLLDGSGGTVLYQFTTVANNAYQIAFSIPIKLSPATALCLTNGGASTGGAIYVNGFTTRG